jgi:hypothetical protein
MNDPDEKAPPRVATGTGQKETNYSNSISAPADRQSCDVEAAERAAIERLALKKYHRQEVADRLAEAQLELALLEIEIRRAELAAIKEGGRHV